MTWKCSWSVKRISTWEKHSLWSADIYRYVYVSKSLYDYNRHVWICTYFCMYMYYAYYAYVYSILPWTWPWVSNPRSSDFMFSAFPTMPPAFPLSSIHYNLIQQAYVRCLLCARHWAVCWECKNKMKRSSSLEEFIIHQKSL